LDVYERQSLGSRTGTVTTPALPGAPYHRLGRAEPRRWWRPVTETLVSNVVGGRAPAARRAAARSAL